MRGGAIVRAGKQSDGKLAFKKDQEPKRRNRTTICLFGGDLDGNNKESKGEGERGRDRWTGSLGKGPKGIGEAYEQIQDLSMRMGRRDEGKPWRCRVGAGLVPLTTSRRGRLQIVTLGRLGFETAPVLN